MVILYACTCRHLLLPLLPPLSPGFLNHSWAHATTHPTELIQLLKIVQVQNGGKKLNKFCPPNSSEDLCLCFSLYPSSMLNSVQTQFRLRWTNIFRIERVAEAIIRCRDVLKIVASPAQCFFLHSFYSSM